MSQAFGAFEAARNVYGTLLPILRRNLAPAAFVFVTTVAGGTFFGPAGVAPGAVAGAGLAVYAQRLLNFFLVAVNFVAENPTLVTAIWGAIDLLRAFLRNPPENNNQIMDHPHAH